MDVISAALVLRRGERYLFQRKDDGYPVEAFRGDLCLVGGSWTERADQCALDTALRELAEEVTPCPSGTPTSLGGFELRVPQLRTGTRDYHILNFIFLLELGGADYELLEGDRAWRSWNDALAGPWCWGYDHILAAIAAPLGETWVGALDPAVTCDRWSGPQRYDELDLSGLRFNPHRDGDIDDAAPLR